MTRVIGAALPMPAAGILSSVRCLHPLDLADVINAAWSFAQRQSMARPETSLAPAWLGAEEALLAYGMAACREVEHRADGPRGQALNLARLAARSIKADLEIRGCAKNVRLSNAAIPRLLVRYRSPSWMSPGTNLYARHRTALLRTQRRAWYQAQGWRQQMDLEENYTLELPPHDALAPAVRWQLDTGKDWGERLDVRR